MRISDWSSDVCSSDLAFQIVFHDVVDPDELRAARARKEEAVRVLRVTHADVPKRVGHALARQDVIGRDEVALQGIQVDHSALDPNPGLLDEDRTSAV